MNEDLVLQSNEPKFNKIRKTLENHEDEFWEKMKYVHPKDFCDIYVKMMQYAYPKVVEEKIVEPKQDKVLSIEETTRRATIIGGGLPEGTIIQ